MTTGILRNFGNLGISSNDHWNSRGSYSTLSGHVGKFFLSWDRRVSCFHRPRSDLEPLKDPQAPGWTRDGPEKFGFNQGSTWIFVGLRSYSVIYIFAGHSLFLTPAALTWSPSRSVLRWLSHERTGGSMCPSRSFPPMRVPSGELTKQWKITIFNGKFYYKWPFSIAMLVHQRVSWGWNLWHTGPNLNDDISWWDFTTIGRAKRWILIVKSFFFFGQNHSEPITVLHIITIFGE